MIVCDLTHAYHPTSGGIRTFIDLKRRYLLEHTSHEHVLIAPGETDRIERGERWTTIHLASPRLPGGSSYRFFPRSKPLREALTQAAPSVVELDTYYMPAEYRAAFVYRAAARAAGRPAIATVHYHTNFVESYVRGYGGLAGRVFEPLARGYVRHILDRADAVMTLAPMFVRQLEDYGVEGVRLVPQFADLEQFSPAHRSEAMRTRAGAGPDDLLLAYVGRFDSEKHVGTLVEMIDRVPGALRPRLLMVGDGPAADRLLARAATSDRLTVWPYLHDKDELATLLASADLYVTAGPHEVAAFSVVEAQASGLPVIGVDAGGLRDRVTQGLGVLVPVDDAEAMARAIADVAADLPAARARVLAHARAAYSWTRCFSAIVATYEEAFDAPTP